MRVGLGKLTTSWNDEGRPFEEEAAYELRTEALRGRSPLRQNLTGKPSRRREELTLRH